MFEQHLPLIMILLIIHGISINTQPTYNTFCEGRIIEHNSSFTVNDINMICSYISSDDRFIFRFIDRKFTDFHLYESNNREFFTTHCHSISTLLCEEGYGISIYNNDIQTLSIHSQSISDLQHIKALTSEDVEITNENIITLSAIIRLVKQLQQIQPNINKTKSHIVYDNNYINIHKSNANQIALLLFFIIIIIPFIFICNVISSLVGFAYMSKPTIYSPLYIHSHINKIKELYDTLNNNNDNTSSPNLTSNTSIITNKCLICFRDLVLQMCFEMKDMSTNSKPLLKRLDANVEMNNDTAIFQFCCGHVYHSLCLHKKNIKCCLMCQDDNENRGECDIMINAIVNKITKQVIMKRHVIRFIINFNLLYEQKELEHHAKVYNNELHKLKENFLRSSQ